MRAAVRTTNIDASRVMIDTSKSIKLCDIEISDTPKKELHMTKNKLLFVYWKEAKEIYLPDASLQKLQFVNFDTTRESETAKENFRTGQQAAKDYVGMKAIEVFEKYFGKVKEG